MTSTSPKPENLFDLSEQAALPLATTDAGVVALSSPPTAFSDYLRIVRLDHWFKNIFVLPGVALAVLLTEARLVNVLFPVLLALLATGFLASANYVINEWLDSATDVHHPLKKSRSGASGRLRPGYILIEYLFLAAAGLSLASFLTPQFVVVGLFFLLMGLVYNVPPIRSKDVAYLDVVSESVNNPIRLLLGWSALASGVFPPSSSILAYWAGGAFLMTVKRYAEYRCIGDPVRASNYRKSFGQYTENSLLLAAFFYAVSSAFFLGVFLIKYRIEFLVSFPFFALLFAWYLSIGMKTDSAAQRPEKIFMSRRFCSYVVFLGLLVTVLFFVDIPFLRILQEVVWFRGVH